MYTQVWGKYLPIIKILLKRSGTADQELPLNRIDFEKLGIARKAGYKFTIIFEDGKASNTIGGIQLARDLASVLLENNDTRYLFKHNTYEVTLTTKFVLLITNKTKQPVPLPSAEPEEKSPVED